MGVQLAVDHHVEAGAAVEERHIPGIAVRRPVRQGEGKHRMTQPRHGLPGSLVVGVGDDIAPLGHQVGEGVEGPLDIRQVLEKVQVVLPTFRITATVGKKFRKELQYSQDSRMMVFPLPTR